MRRKARIIIPRRFSHPRYLRTEMLVLTSFVVVTLFAGAIAMDRYVIKSGNPYVAAVIAAVLTELANQDRAGLALQELKVNPELVTAAQAKADDMAQKGYFAHTTPDGFDSWHWFKLAGYNYAYAGENLAVDFSESSDVEKAWMNSPTHRANVLNPHYTEIGIATAVGMYQGRTTIFVAQMFGSPKTTRVPPPLPQPIVQATSTQPNVLGEAVESESVQEEPTGALAEQDLPGRQAGGDPIREPTASNGAGASAITVEEIPWWAYIAVNPKSTLKYAYYIIGLLVVLALLFDIELELRWHHIRHAMRAGIVLVTMSMLFVVAEWLFFAEPLLAQVGKIF